MSSRAHRLGADFGESRSFGPELHGPESDIMSTIKVSTDSRELEKSAVLEMGSVRVKRWRSY
jgi:hypothetical protein